MTTAPRVRLHHGSTSNFASMPTCGVCRAQITRGEQYASVANTDGTLREVRHNTDACLRYEHGPAVVLVPGTVVYSTRYSVCEWGGRVPGVITERTDRFDKRGWRAYVIEPEGTVDTAAIVASFRSHREPFFRGLADSLVFDLGPQEVFISDVEWTHYVLPS